MSKLIWYEGHKLFKKKTIWTVILLMVLLNCLVTYNQIYTKNENLYNSADVAKIYAEIKDLDNNEDKLQYLTDNMVNDYFDEIPDEGIIARVNAIKQVYDEIETTDGYADFLQEIDNKAEDMADSFFFTDPNSFSYRNLEKTPKAYNHLKDIEPEADFSDGVKAITDAHTADIFLLISMLAIVLTLSVSERENGTLSLIKPTKYGYFHTITAKGIHIFIFTAILILLFYGGSLAVVVNTVGLGNTDRVIQSISGYMASPYLLSVKQYMTLFFAAKFFGISAVMCIFFLLCQLCKNTVYSCLSGISLFLIELLAYIKINSDSYVSFFKEFNIAALCDTSHYFDNYVNLNLFNIPVNTSLIGIIITVLSIVFCLFFGIYSYVKETSVEAKSNFIKEKLQYRTKKSKRVNVNLLSFETYKILIDQKALLILAVLILVQIFSAGNINYFIDKEEYYYQSYCSYLSGELTDEKSDYMQAEKINIDDTQSIIDKLNTQYENGDISYSTLQIELYSLNVDESKSNAFHRAYDQYMQLEEISHSGKDVSFVYQTPWEKLITNDALVYDLISIAFLFLALILAFSSSASVEKTTDMDKIITISPKGIKAVEKRKMAVITTFAFLSAIIVFLPRIAMVVNTYGLTELSAPVQSIPVLSSIPFKMSLIMFFVLLQLCRLIVTGIVSVLIYFISKASGNKIITIIISSLLFVIPSIIFLIRYI